MEEVADSEGMADDAVVMALDTSELDISLLPVVIEPLAEDIADEADSVMVGACVVVPEAAVVPVPVAVISDSMDDAAVPVAEAVLLVLAESV